MEKALLTRSFNPPSFLPRLSDGALITFESMMSGCCYCLRWWRCMCGVQEWRRWWWKRWWYFYYNFIERLVSRLYYSQTHAQIRDSDGCAYKSSFTKLSRCISITRHFVYHNTNNIMRYRRTHSLCIFTHLQYRHDVYVHHSKILLFSTRTYNTFGNDRHKKD